MIGCIFDRKVTFYGKKWPWPLPKPNDIDINLDDYILVFNTQTTYLLWHQNQEN